MSGFTEAPASWNVRYRTAEGFDAMLTLRGESGDEVLPKAEAAIAWLLEHGAQPGGKGYKDNGQALGTKICPIHHLAMRKRSKNGDTWWSHRAVDPDTG